MSNEKRKYKPNAVKAERDVFKKDISGDDSTYAYHLERNLGEINRMAMSQMSAQAMMQSVIEIVKPAHDTAAKRNFVATLLKQCSKQRIQEYVYNAILMSKGLGVI